MKKSRFNEEQIIGILRDGQGGTTVKAVCVKHNVSEQTYYGWKRKYGGMEISEMRKAKALEEECGRLRRLVADLSIQIQILKEEPERSGDSLPLGSPQGQHTKWHGKTQKSGRPGCKTPGGEGEHGGRPSPAVRWIWRDRATIALRGWLGV